LVSMFSILDQKAGRRKVKLSYFNNVDCNVLTALIVHLFRYTIK